ncbi:MAG: hypothetical protein KBS94_06025 [Prevotella sp.]|nr:hypothetical protein [Candidatus Equicola faecalis]
MKRPILMFCVLMMTLCSHAVNVSIKMNSVSTSMILVEKSTNDTINVDAPDKSFTYQLNLKPATYTLTGVNKDGATLQGTIELTVTDEAEQSFTIWTVQSIKATNSGWVYGEDYTIEELSCRTREGKTIPVTLGNGTAAGTKACLILNGGSFNCTLRPSAAHQAEGYVDAYASATVTGNTSSSSAIPMSGIFTVDFPADAHCMVFRKLGGTLGSGSIHYVPFVSITPTDSVSGQETFRLAEGGTYSYRLWKEGKRTKAGTFVFYQGSTYDGKMWDETCDGFSHITFTDDDLSESSKYINHSTADNNKSNVANILLNINERGHLCLKSGQTKDLLAQRDWQLTNSQTANYFIEPDYHYTVLDMDGNPGSDIISIDNADTSISPWATLHANKAGSAIVLVSYDAMHLTQWARSGSGNDKKPYTIKESDFCFGADWSACWGENTGVFVVTVDDNETAVQPNMTINEAYNAATMKNAGKYVDAEHDCFYYLNGEDGYHYTFAPVDAASVAIAYPQLTDLTASYSGFTPVEANTDGSYTLILKHGRQIVRITGNDGGIVYQVLTAKECTRTISNLTHDDGKFYPGDEIAIQYDGLFHPANKMSGIYNMSAYITYNGVPTGTELILGSNQYAFGGTPKAQCVKTTIPDTWEPGTPFILDDGVIQVTGFGDPIGNHRFIDKIAGRSPNFTAIAHKTYFGSIPDVKIEISAPDAPTSTAVLSVNASKTVHYDLVGRRTSDKSKGIHVIRMQEGSVRKVLVK